MIYIVDFYCNTNYNEITLYLNPVKITYLLEVFDDHHFIMGWDVCLTFRIEQQQKIIKEEELVNENVKYRDSRILNDYTAKINEHFKTELPLILNL